MEAIQIDDKWIGPGYPTYVIAEVGVNHKGSLEAAKRLIDEARRAGADAIKFQTYKAEKLVTRSAPVFWTEPEATATQYAVYKRTDSFGEDEYRALYAHAQNVGITWLSTAFDLEAVDFLDRLEMPVFKVASADLTNYPLLMEVAGRGKPVILSTGGSTLVEIRAAVDFLWRHGCRQLALLYAVLSYPTLPEDTHLLRLGTLQREFPSYPVGFSDHSPPADCLPVALGAVALGAYAVQRPFTLDPSLPGDDHARSSGPAQFATMVQSIRALELALGDPHLDVQSAEEAARQYARRSVVAARFIPMGTCIARDMLIMKRPGTGIQPAELPNLIGRVATVDIQPDTVLNWDMVE